MQPRSLQTSGNLRTLARLDLEPARQSRTGEENQELLFLKERASELERAREAMSKKSEVFFSESKKTYPSPLPSSLSTPPPPLPRPPLPPSKVLRRVVLGRHEARRGRGVDGGHRRRPLPVVEWRRELVARARRPDGQRQHAGSGPVVQRERRGRRGERRERVDLH